MQLAQKAHAIQLIEAGDGGYTSYASLLVLPDPFTTKGREAISRACPEHNLTQDFHAHELVLFHVPPISKEVSQFVRLCGGQLDRLESLGEVVGA